MSIISIIIANYNNSHYLPECFNSILGQTYKNIEIVVVDDCSTDNSKSIIQSFTDKYPGIFSPVLLKKNVGVARARHEGVLNAKGQYLTTLDADDYFADNKKLEIEIALCQQYQKTNNRQCISFSNIIILNSEGKFYNIGENSVIVQGNILNQIMARNCMIPRDFLFTKDMYFNVGGYDYRFPIYEDWDLKIRLAANYPFHYTGINGIIYRRHGVGLSNASSIKHIKVTKQIFNKNQKLLLPNDRKKTYSEFHKFIEKHKSKLVKSYVSSIVYYRNKKDYYKMIVNYLKLVKLDISYINVKKLTSLANNNKNEYK